MSEAKFTGGEWSYDANSGLIITTAKTNSEDDIICNMLPIDNLDEELANAHLIAAAPEMYRLLMHYHRKSNFVYGKNYDEAEDLLAKARGEL